MGVSSASWKTDESSSRSAAERAYRPRVSHVMEYWANSSREMAPHVGFRLVNLSGRKR